LFALEICLSDRTTTPVMFNNTSLMLGASVMLRMLFILSNTIKQLIDFLVGR